jgi:hypothetical protein
MKVEISSVTAKFTAVKLQKKKKSPSALLEGRSDCRDVVCEFESDCSNEQMIIKSRLQCSPSTTRKTIKPSVSTHLWRHWPHKVALLSDNTICVVPIPSATLLIRGDGLCGILIPSRGECQIRQERVHDRGRMLGEEGSGVTKLECSRPPLVPLIYSIPAETLHVNLI